MQTCPGFFLKSLLESPVNLLEICSVKFVDTLLEMSYQDFFSDNGTALWLRSRSGITLVVHHRLQYVQSTLRLICCPLNVLLSHVPKQSLWE